jgi:membrane protease YdiL (CAAX protease family)
MNGGRSEGPAVSAPDARCAAERAEHRWRTVRDALSTALLVTALVTLASSYAPERHVATAVGAIFLGATWIHVWRKDDATVIRHGVDLGGLVLPARIGEAFARRAAVAVGWALLVAAVTFPPFVVGWRAVWHPPLPFELGRVGAQSVVTEFAAQLLLVALPEEAFFRGYLQTQLTDALPPRGQILGAPFGWAVLLTSAVFALGHVATVPEAGRLAVFVPSLLFGWLRARTGGIGAGCIYHALCNTISDTLVRGHGWG